MHRHLQFASAVVLLTGVLGCGSSPPPPKAAAAPTPAAKAELPKEGGTVGKGANAKSPEKTAVAKTDVKKDDKKDNKRAGRAGLSQLFQVPEIPQEFLVQKEEKRPEGTATPMRRNERPLMRLIGFAKMDGKRQALLEVKGDVIAAGVNDLVEGAEVVSLDANSITFQFSGTRWETKLFEQPWLNEQKGTTSTSNIARSAPRPARSSASRSGNSRSAFAAQSRSTPAVNYAQPGGPMATGGNIPGMAGISSDGAVPGMAGSTGSGIPGMTTPSSGSPGAGGSPAGLPGVSAGGPTAGPGAGPMSAGAMPGGQSAGPSPGGIPAGPGGPSAGGLPLP